VIKSYLIKSLKSDKYKKSFTLFSTMMLSIVVGILVSIVNTRYLGKELYGDFKFIINIFSFFVTFLTFGFFYSGSRIIARSETKYERKKIFGEIFIFGLIIGLLLIIISIIYSFFQESLFKRDLQTELLICIPLIIVVPLQLCLEQLFQGDNRIYSLSILRIGPKILYLAGAFSLFTYFKFNLSIALLAHFMSFFLIIILLIFRYKPVFKMPFEYLDILKNENKRYGFPVFLGGISGVASNYLSSLSISYFIDNVNVGYYSLALTATLPLSMLPATLGIIFFKDFVSMKKIPKKITGITFGMGIFVFICFYFLIEKIVLLLYSEEFRPVVQLTYYTALGSLLHGFGDFFNRFLSAKGLGKQLRNSNFILGGINILGYIVLVYYFDTIGAAITKLIAGFFYLIIMSNYYLRYLIKQK
jgi:O-antigen/teichoic acid export membrane protein